MHGPGALVVMEEVINCGPRVLSSGSGIEDDIGDVIHDGTKNLSLQEIVGFEPFVIGGACRFGGTIKEPLDPETPGSDEEKVFPLLEIWVFDIEGGGKGNCSGLAWVGFW